MQIEMIIKGLIVDPTTNVPMVILRDKEGERELPIWMGIFEADAIARQIENISMPRPMTHDLLRNVLGELGATVEAIEVTDLRDNTYYALVHLVVDGRRVAIDSRPSDAISLALRTKSPIYVAKKVLESSSVLQQMDDDKEQNLSNVSRDKWAEILEKMAPDDFKYKM